MSIFILSLILNKLLIKYSNGIGLIDIPNKRSLHKIKKARSGGVAIFISFLFSIFSIGFEIDDFVITSFFMVFLIGLIDDFINISSNKKFIFIGIVATYLFFNDFVFYKIGTFFGIEIFMNQSIAYFFFIFALVGFINAMNLIDGLDGLSSGIAIVMLSAYAYLGYKYNDQFLFFISLSLIIPLIAFLFYNWFPSKIFMGDSGSLTLGLSISLLSIHSVKMNYITPVTILLIAAVPILDTLIVMIRRLSSKNNPFRPDRTHIHHIILSQQGKNVSRTTKILILLQLIFTYIGLGFKVRDDLLILIIFVLLFTLFYYLLTPKKKKYQ